MYSYGIDLGTTYSCIARADNNNKVEVIKNIEGSYTTPSIVEFLDNNTTIVGDNAKEDMKLDSSNVCLSIKRFMGKQGEVRKYHGREFTPEQISAFILRKLVSDAEQMTGDKITDVVITIPAYFGVAERQATTNAGKIAGLNVLSLVNEPTAAILAYTKERAFLGSRSVLVYDLGGGTFDVAVANILENNIEIIATAGSPSLGGNDWDTELVTFFINQYCQVTMENPKEIYADSEVYNEFLLKAEDAKKRLTNKDSETIIIDRGSGKRAKLSVTIDDFNYITKHLLRSTMEHTKDVIRQASEKKGLPEGSLITINDIIFVGGSTRMRQVKDAIIKEFGIEPQIFEPDEAIARGAAIRASQIQQGSINMSIEESRQYSSSNIHFLPIGSSNFSLHETQGEHPQNSAMFMDSAGFSEVISKSYGIRAKIDGIPRLSHVILKNDKIPCSRTKTYRVDTPNQTSIEIVVYESNKMEPWADLSYGKRIAIGILQIPTGLPAGSLIDVTFNFCNNGMLDITATERSKGINCTINVKTEGLSDFK